MEITTIKTVLTYTKGEEVKKVLCHYLVDEPYKHNIESELSSKNPFDIPGNEEIYQTTDDAYTIEIHETEDSRVTVHVTVEYVLEFKGKVFGGLKELNLSEFE